MSLGSCWSRRGSGAKVLVGAVREVEAIGACSAGETIVAGGEVGARNSKIVQPSTAAILAVIQHLSMSYSNVRGLSGLRPCIGIAFLQSRLGSAPSNLSVLTYSTIMLRSVTTPLMSSYVRRKDFRNSVSSRPQNLAQRLLR